MITFRAGFSWWLQQLASLLPRAWRGRSAGNGLVVAIDPRGVTLLRRRNGQERRLAALPAGGSATVPARLPARPRRGPVVVRTGATLLERDVTLPLAAEGQEARVLGYEMDRLTPFRAEDLFWDWEPLRRDKAQGRLHLRLWLLPRAPLQPVLETLAPIGLAPDLLEAAGSGGVARLIRLRRPTASARRGARVAAGACAVLAAAAVAVPFVRQSLDAAAVERRIAALRAPVAEVAALRRREAAGGDVAVAERQRLGDAIAVLVAVTRALPDDTYLTEFSLRARRLRLAGQSGAAAALIKLLGSAPHLRNPAFAAPVTRSDTGRGDVFAIEAELAP